MLIRNVTIVGNAEIAIENSSISISNSIIESEISNTDSSYLEITYSNIYGGSIRRREEILMKIHFFVT